MKKLMTAALAAGLSVSGIALAHPTTIPYDTRGECEAAYAEFSKFDRERLVEMGVFDSLGEAQRTFNEIFRCEYDESLDLWFIERLE